MAGCFQWTSKAWVMISDDQSSSEIGDHDLDWFGGYWSVNKYHENLWTMFYSSKDSKGIPQSCACQVYQFSSPWTMAAEWIVPLHKQRTSSTGGSQGRTWMTWRQCIVLQNCSSFSCLSSVPVVKLEGMAIPHQGNAVSHKQQRFFVERATLHIPGKRDPKIASLQWFHVHLGGILRYVDWNCRLYRELNRRMEGVKG